MSFTIVSEDERGLVVNLYWAAVSAADISQTPDVHADKDPIKKVSAPADLVDWPGPSNSNNACLNDLYDCTAGVLSQVSQCLLIGQISELAS